MDVYLGIDLGSTTSKAVIVNKQRQIIGRGITNTRSNYQVAADIARMEAEFSSRFMILYDRLKETYPDKSIWKEIIPVLESRFDYLQFHARFDTLISKMKTEAIDTQNGVDKKQILSSLEQAAISIEKSVKDRFFSSATSGTSEFFRDLFSVAYIDAIGDKHKNMFDTMMALYDRCITPVENRMISFDFAKLMLEALDLLPEELRHNRDKIEPLLDDVSKIDLKPNDFIGTGYGRQLLPFDKKHIKSEILCHAYGAHAYFPDTRTVLDIGGQDTKAIQVDSKGLVTSFQMNDRCAAGCGRYLGYIADEMSMSVGELGPIALDAKLETNICSTCTVFAGAELREHLNLGERKEDILAGLHKAIVQRAFALLARSGGVRDEFTFTGGVARNPAVLKYVKQMIVDNYGKMKMNCHTDSIFMGALGAALFSASR